jgi:hypothetical protein
VLFSLSDSAAHGQLPLEFTQETPRSSCFTANWLSAGASEQPNQNDRPLHVPSLRHLLGAGQPEASTAIRR